MYLKKVTGPRAVKLDDGTVLTVADLPPSDTRRWVASRKAAVIQALKAGMMSREAAIKRWDLSEEELDIWESAIDRHGARGLKVTQIQKYRQL